MVGWNIDPKVIIYCEWIEMFDHSWLTVKEIIQRIREIGMLKWICQLGLTHTRLWIDLNQSRSVRNKFVKWILTLFSFLICNLYRHVDFVLNSNKEKMKYALLKTESLKLEWLAAGLWFFWTVLILNEYVLKEKAVGNIT